MLVKRPRKNKWSTPYERVFYVVCSIRGSQVTARGVTDGQTLCRDASQFKLANAVINTTDEPERNEEVQTPQTVPDLEIPEKETPPSTLPVPPGTTTSAEKPMEPPGAEIIPEQETESKQRVEHNQQVDRAAVTTPRRERRQLHISRTMC